MPYKDMDKKRTRDNRWYQDHPEPGKAISRKRYADDPAYFNDRNTQRRQVLRELIQQQKMGRSCVRCGIDDIRVLDFHHLDKDGKEGTIGHVVSQNWSVERILAEIAKCEVLCSNCHRILHWEEKHGC